MNTRLPIALSGFLLTVVFCLFVVLMVWTSVPTTTRAMGRQCDTDMDCVTHCGVDGARCDPPGFIPAYRDERR